MTRPEVRLSSEDPVSSAFSPQLVHSLPSCRLDAGFALVHAACLDSSVLLILCIRYPLPADRGYLGLNWHLWPFKLHLEKKN